LDRIYADHDEDKPIYQSDVNFAFNSLNWTNIKDPLLVISGGKTKAERDCSESRSYVQWANKLGINFPEEKIALEEYAMTSIENLLFSLYVYADRRGYFPEHINIISWEFKRERFEKTLEAINGWDSLRNWSKKIWKGFSAEWEHSVFMPVGDLWGEPQSFAETDEQQEVELLKQGIETYYLDRRVDDKIKERDKYNTRSLAARRYKFYPLPTPLETLKP
jgi:hypothetical protein